jgi:hypothetical protein
MTAPTQQPATLSHIYAPSKAEVPVVRPAPAKRPLRMFFYAAASLGATCAGLAVVHGAEARWIGRIGFTLCALAALVGSVSAVGAWLRASARPKGTRAVLVNLGALAGNGAMLFVGAIGALLSTFGFSRGRQLRRFGRVMLPRVIGGHAWSHTKVSVVAPSPIPDGLADQWRENGRTEHASVAAFARLTLDLVALGAPPHLIAASQADAIDEVRHAELCFSLARSLDGRQEDPGPFPAARRARTLPPTRMLGLAVLAVDSLVDGALHEGVSARVIAKLAKRSDVPAIRGMLKEIAADEGRHAAHGWDVVEWCLAEGKAPVASALVGALRTLPTRMRASVPDAARDGSWEPWGIHGDALAQREYAEARAALVERVERMIHRTRHAA